MFSSILYNNNKYKNMHFAVKVKVAQMSALIHGMMMRMMMMITIVLKHYSLRRQGFYMSNCYCSFLKNVVLQVYFLLLT